MKMKQNVVGVRTLPMGTSDWRLFFHITFLSTDRVQSLLSTGNHMVGIHWEAPLNSDLNINTKDRTVKQVQCGRGYLWQREGWMKDIKVREYGWWTLWYLHEIEQRNLLQLL
jgi:hypothetical protein